MAKNNKKIMNHHKRNHNGRQRARKDDVPKNVDRTTSVPAAAAQRTSQTVTRPSPTPSKPLDPPWSGARFADAGSPTLPSTLSAALAAACAT